MSLIINDKEWEAEVIAFEDAIFEICTQSKLEYPSQKTTRSQGINSYVDETSEMFDLVEMYLALLTKDLEYVKEKVQEIKDVDVTSSKVINLGATGENIL